MSHDSKENSRGSPGKIVKLIEKYDIPEVGDELEKHWTADDDRKSLRDLAVHFNEALLRSALDTQDVEVLPGEVENLYELLTSDDVTSGVRTETENKIRDYGIDVEQLSTDFVSRQAIHTYLTSHRNAEYKSAEFTDDVLDRRLQELKRLRSRHTTVAEQTLSDLTSSDQLSLGDTQVLVSVRVQCSDCRSQFDLNDLIARGGCDCSS